MWHHRKQRVSENCTVSESQEVSCRWVERSCRWSYKLVLISELIRLPSDRRRKIKKCVCDDLRCHQVYRVFFLHIYSTNKLHPIGHSIRLIFQRINSSLSGDLIIIDFTAVHCVQKRRGKKMLRRYEITVLVLRENWPLCCRTTQHSTDIPRSLDKLIRTNLFLPDVMWMLQGTGGFVARKHEEEMAINGEGKKDGIFTCFHIYF